jgi:hypothetical protein
MTTPAEITAALTASLATATEANGYSSDIGRAVFVGELRGDAVQTPCTFILPGRTTFSGPDATRTYDITGYCDASAAGLSEHGLVDAIAWDIRRCLAAEDPALAALVRQIRVAGDSPGYREDGGSLVGASVAIEVEFGV